MAYLGKCTVRTCEEDGIAFMAYPRIVKEKDRGFNGCFCQDHLKLANDEPDEMYELLKEMISE